MLIQGDVGNIGPDLKFAMRMPRNYMGSTEIFQTMQFDKTVVKYFTVYYWALLKLFASNRKNK